MELLKHKIETEVDFINLLEQFLKQNGYDSENGKRGVKSAEKDYEAVFGKKAPEWLSKIWTSTAVSVLHLAVEAKRKLPDAVEIPVEALRR